MITLTNYEPAYILTEDELNKYYADAYEEGARDVKAALEKTEEAIRDSERNRIFSVVRHSGFKIDQKKVMKLYKEWEESRKIAGEKNETQGTGEQELRSDDSKDRPPQPA